MKKLALSLLFAAMAAVPLAADPCQATQITGTISNYDSSPFSGTITITWPDQTTLGVPRRAGSYTVNILNGAVNFSLCPSQMPYTVTYSDSVTHQPIQRQWLVPWTAGTPAPLTSVQIASSSPSARTVTSVTTDPSGTCNPLTDSPQLNTNGNFWVCSGGIWNSINALVSNGLVARYDMVTTNGSVLKDLSGNGNDATLGSGTQSPTKTNLGLVFAKSAATRVQLPAMTSAIGTVQIFADTTPFQDENVTGQVAPLLGAGTSAGFQFIHGSGTSKNPTMISSAYFPAGIEVQRGTDGCMGICDIAVTTGATPHIYADGVESPYYPVSGSLANITFATGGPYYLGAGPVYSNYMDGTIYYALFYNRALSAAEIAQNDAAMRSILRARGVTQFQYPKNVSGNWLYAIGDSLTYGQSAANGWPAYLSTADSFTVRNLGIQCQTMRSIRYEYSTMAKAMLPSGGRSIVVLFAGTNDVNTTACGALAATPAQVFNDMVSTAKNFRAAGHQVVVIPMFSRNGYDPQHDALNALVTERWPTFADAILDPKNPAVYSQFYADGAYLANQAGTACSGSPCFNSDGTHPTTAGQQLLASAISIVINSLGAGYNGRYVQATDPGCTSSYMAGRVWFDSTDPNNTKMKVCMSVSGTMQWVAK